jgi:hypothetical protein
MTTHGCDHRKGEKGSCEDPDHNFGGNPFKPGGHAHCVCCGLLVCDEPTFADRHTPYEEDGHCLPCAAADEGLTPVQFAGVMNNRRD